MQKRKRGMKKRLLCESIGIENTDFEGTDMEWLNDFLKPELIWFVIGIGLILAEFIVPGLVIIFFGIGACVVGTTCFFAEISLNTQLILFIGTSVVSLVLMRKWLKGIFMGHITSKQNLLKDMEDFVGERAVVIRKITPLLAGKVELHGTGWEAQASEEISEGTVVEVIGKDNITLKVKKA